MEAKKLEIEGIKYGVSNLNAFIFIENTYDKLLDNEFKETILAYEGCRTVQRIYHVQELSLFYSINQFLYIKKAEGIASLEAILEGHKYYGYEDFIPFVIDSGGWDFNISISPKNYGQVWINKFDNGEENPFEFVCKSFGQFINSLITEDEAIALGY